MTLLHQFSYSTPKFLRTLLVFACIAAAIVFWFAAPKSGHPALKGWLVPVGFLVVVFAVTGIYNARHAQQLRLRLFDEGMQSGPRLIAWRDVTDIRLEDRGMDAPSFHLEVSLQDGTTASHDVALLTASRRDIFRRAHAAWQAWR